MLNAKSFNEIPKKIDFLNFRLNNGTKEIKDHCLKLRMEVMSEAESAIEKIRYRGEELIDFVNQYERNTLNDFEVEVAKKANFKEFIDELESFYKTCPQNLNNCQLKDLESEIDKANSFIEAVGERFQKANILLENLIFN